MSDFFEISAADADGYGMMMQYNESGGQGLSGLWASRMKDGRFNMDIFPWREAEAKALKRTHYLTIVQRHDPTDFIDPDPKDANGDFYVNKRVIEAMDAAGLKGWTAHAIYGEVVNGRGEILRHEVFFSIIPAGEAPECILEMWEPSAPPQKGLKGMAPAGYKKWKEPTKDVKKEQWQVPSVRNVPVPETWDKNDIMFGLKGDSYKGSFWCSRKVLELAYREQWTNAAFQPVDLLEHNHTDFRLRCWPPEKWYPKWHPGFRADLHPGEKCEPKTPAETLADFEARPASWKIVAELLPLNESTVLPYMKKHAKELSEFSKEETAHFADRLDDFADVCSYLNPLLPGPAEEGFLVSALGRPPDDDAEMAKWFRALSPARKVKVELIIKDPPDELILSATMGDLLSQGEYRRSLVKLFGLKLEIADREGMDF